MPSPSVAGTWVMAVDKTGTANTNNISFLQNGSEKLEGVAATYVYMTNFGAVFWISNGIDWYRF